MMENDRIFDEYEIYYLGELIAEVKDYRRGFSAILYNLSTDAKIIEKEYVGKNNPTIDKGVK